MSLGFNHRKAKVDEDGKVIEHVCGPTKPCKAVTTAFLRFPDDEVWIGNAWCSLDDQFNKERGRKIALARALQHSPDRSWRRQVWDAYFARAL